jgi:hypothetical protein
MLARVGYEWLGTALDGLRNLEPHEVLQVLDPRRRRWPRPAVTSSGVQVLSIWGRTNTGRPLIVAVRHVSGFDQLIVGAREMQAKELTEFEEWEARDE